MPEKSQTLRGVGIQRGGGAVWLFNGVFCAQIKSPLNVACGVTEGEFGGTHCVFTPSGLCVWMLPACRLKVSFMPSVKYGYRRSLLSIFYLHLVRICACFLKAYWYRQNVAVLPEIVGQRFKRNTLSVYQDNYVVHTIYYEHGKLYCALDFNNGTSQRRSRYTVINIVSYSILSFPAVIFF